MARQSGFPNHQSLRGESPRGPSDLVSTLPLWEARGLQGVDVPLRDEDAGLPPAQIPKVGRHVFVLSIPVV